MINKKMARAGCLFAGMAGVLLLTLLACSETKKDQSKALNEWFEVAFEEQLARSPEFQTYLGRKTNYDRWDDKTVEFAQRALLEDQQKISEMRSKFNFDDLEPATQLSWDLFVNNQKSNDEGWKFHDYNYVFNPFRGVHHYVPSFLINQHRVDSLLDAEAYIARIKDVRRMLGEELTNYQRAYTRGIYPPRWTYPQMLQTVKKIISGRPFEKSRYDNPVYADFKKKIATLSISDKERKRLRAAASVALVEYMKPAYERLVNVFREHEKGVNNGDGVWKLPDGDKFYQYLLRSHTTTNMQADDIHNLGLAEVRRIHDEIKDVMQTLGYSGTMAEFFDHSRTGKEFFYPNTKSGRKAYLKKSEELIAAMWEKLPQAFNILPKAKLIVKRVEKFRENAGKAFYERPTISGSRPGAYYVNLSNMKEMPNSQMEALAFHEGVPGHHLQIAIAQELQGIPSFRRFNDYTAYVEGWGLYSEFLAKQMGFYQDPYSDFGRLAMELWRAARLVVDTGIHSKRWSRERAIEYLLTNTPNPKADCIAAIERYIVYPGQATAYKIGMLEIMKLRDKSMARLVDSFKLGDFHDVVLGSGPVPLSVLGDLVDQWLQEKSK